MNIRLVKVASGVRFNTDPSVDDTDTEQEEEEEEQEPDRMKITHDDVDTAVPTIAEKEKRKKSSENGRQHGEPKKEKRFVE